MAAARYGIRPPFTVLDTARPGMRPLIPINDGHSSGLSKLLAKPTLPLITLCHSPAYTKKIKKKKKRKEEKKIYRAAASRARLRCAPRAKRHLSRERGRRSLAASGRKKRHGGSPGGAASCPRLSHRAEDASRPRGPVAVACRRPWCSRMGHPKPSGSPMPWSSPSLGRAPPCLFFLARASMALEIQRAPMRLQLRPSERAPSPALDAAARAPCSASGRRSFGCVEDVVWPGGARRVGGRVEASGARAEDYEKRLRGLLSNGDFETAPAGGFVKSASVAEGASSIPGWTINGTVELISAGQHQGGMILIVPQGDHAVRLGNDASVGQVVDVEKGSEYAITFSAARTCAQLEALNVSVLGGVSQTVDLQTLYNIEGWDAYALAFQATEEQAHLQFMNPGMEDDPTCGPILDNVAVKKLFTPDKPKDNVVLNGDFEEGPWMFPNTSFGVLLPTNLDEQTSAIPGWMIESNRAVRYIDSDEYKVPQGKRAIELLSGKEGIISQMVETTPQKVYSLTFTMGTAGDSCQPPMAVMAFAGDQAQNFHYSPMGNATSQAANVTFTARAERTRVAFYSVYYNTRSDDHSSLCGPVIDDVRVWGLNAVAGLKASIGLVLGIVGVVGMVLF